MSEERQNRQRTTNEEGQARQRRSRGPQAKNWVFTINNPTESGETLIERLKNDRHVVFAIFQLERGESGTPHFQGYIQLNQRERRPYIERLTGGHSWCDPARGSSEEAIAYASKEETRVDGPWRTGQPRLLEPKREQIATAVDTGEIKRVRDAPTEYLLQPGAAKALGNVLSMRAKGKRREDLKVVCLYGLSGFGKTYLVHSLFNEEDIASALYGNAGLWFPGYEDQDVLLLDEFAGQIQMQKLIQLLDIYPVALEVKGDTVWARYTKVFLCSNRDPKLWYKDTTAQQGQALITEASAQASRIGEKKALFRRLGIEDPPAGCPRRGLTIDVDERLAMAGGDLELARRMVEEEVRDFLGLGRPQEEEDSESDGEPPRRRQRSRSPDL